jgi:hypothetical protein
VSSYPYTEKTVRGMRQSLGFFWGSSLMRRLFG